MVPLFIGLALGVGLILGRIRRAPVKATAAGGAVAAILSAAAAFVGPWEGLETDAYLDRIASPAVWTVCYGETRGVKAGDSYTAEECADKLAVALGEYRGQLAACIPDLPRQPEGVQVALTSWAYNVGGGAACGSTLARMANAGDWRGACDQLPRWNKAGGKVVRGLTNRRAAERDLCIKAIGG
ncbi:lysozyme [Rhodobacter phage RcRhea]|uniref:Endolysin n=1 Tax=Rhodobacter phage RcRhea TaxID=1662332 RepID=A0A0K1LL70_9CAUD|nr:endolysin [Rhodobacter phage RcRhea]AKU43247.1 lysozyme [Rhodobacter phage RcRhea]